MTIIWHIDDLKVYYTDLHEITKLAVQHLWVNCSKKWKGAQLPWNDLRLQNVRRGKSINDPVDHEHYHLCLTIY